MKLTKETLKRIIKEELDSVLSEYELEEGAGNPEPEAPSGIKPDHAAKIKKMLQAEDEYLVNQALMLIDTLAPGSSFGTDYLEYLDANKTQATLDSYGDSYDPDERIDLKKKIYDQINQRAARLYPDDKKAANNWAMDKIEQAGLLEEGILQQMEAEKILRDEFFRVKELRAQGKATEEELTKAYEDMKNLDTDQFYTPEELASAEAERAEREQRYQDRLDSEDAEERARNARLGQDRIAALKTRSGYKDRGIDMGPDDPGDVDDLYPDLREAKLDPTFFADIEGRRTFTDRVLADPEVNPKIKAMLEQALDLPLGPERDAEINQVDNLLRALYPKYAKELDRYDSQPVPRYSPKPEPVGLSESLLYEGDDSVLALFEDATLEEGGNACGACLFEQLQEASCGCPDLMGEAEYQGRKVTLNKPTRGDVKKFKVYVKDPKTGNIKKVNFGDPNMKIKKSNPKRRKSFRARHNCDNPGPKTKARYWSCKKW